MQDFYQRNIEAYHEMTFHINPTSFLEPLIGYLRAGASILDVGCGGGRDLCWFKERGFNVTGFERSKGLAELAGKNDFNILEFQKDISKVNAIDTWLSYVLKK